MKTCFNYFYVSFQLEACMRSGLHLISSNWRREEIILFFLDVWIVLIILPVIRDLKQTWKYQLSNKRGTVYIVNISTLFSLNFLHSDYELLT